MTPTPPPAPGEHGAVRPARQGVDRIRDRRTFQAFRHARRARRGPLSVAWVADREGRPRVAYAIGRRAGGAVQRNRIRRRLRAAMAAEAATLPPGAYLVGATAEAAGLGPEELQSTLSELIKAVTRR